MANKEVSIFLGICVIMFIIVFFAMSAEHIKEVKELKEVSVEEISMSMPKKLQWAEDK